MPVPPKAHIKYGEMLTLNWHYGHIKLHPKMVQSRIILLNHIRFIDVEL